MRFLTPALLIFSLSWVAFIPSQAPASNGATALIDDFSSQNAVSSLGTSWSAFTDRVMGGRSEMQASLSHGEHGHALHLRGQVRLDNNGGFIQVRLPLAAQGRYDAGDWDGLRVLARGQPGAYYVHLRSRHTWRPWQFYSAALPVHSEWQWIELPFAAFQGQSIRRDLDISQLSTLAVVGYGEVFDADIEVAQIEWFKSTGLTDL